MMRVHNLHSDYSYSEDCPLWCRYRKWDNENKELICEVSRNECQKYLDMMKEHLAEIIEEETKQKMREEMGDEDN